MIGKVYKSVFPYYDAATKTNRFKVRPCLIIGKADAGDYVVLPISSVHDKSRIHPEYDIYLESSVFGFLKNDSYLRTNKQIIVNVALLRGEIADLKNQYEEVYMQALAKVEQFQKQLITDAL